MYVYICIYGNFTGDKDIEIRLLLRTLFLEGFWTLSGNKFAQNLIDMDITK